MSELASLVSFLEFLVECAQKRDDRVDIRGLQSDFQQLLVRFTELAHASKFAQSDHFLYDIRYSVDRTVVKIRIGIAQVTQRGRFEGRDHPPEKTVVAFIFFPQR